MAMDKYKIRHHDRLRHLPRATVRRPTMGKAAACNVLVFDDGDVRALAEKLHKRDSRGGGGDPDGGDGGDDDDDGALAWAPPAGKCTATDAMKLYPAIRNHNQLKHLHRVKVRRPAFGRASGCDIYVYDEDDVRGLAQALAKSEPLDDDENQDGCGPPKDDPDACTSQEGSSLADDEVGREPRSDGRSVDAAADAVARGHDQPPTLDIAPDDGGGGGDGEPPVAAKQDHAPPSPESPCAVTSDLEHADDAADQPPKPTDGDRFVPAPRALAA